ncbi:hypothetical protein MIR68_000877 [Amoeboaphelidium protococcarum]|nr:hypothetical protein MIR68_000877 [Amoeboaphelidium protococcarum]
MEKFDVFSKVDVAYKKQTSQGGAMTLLTVCLMSALILAEIGNYFSVDHQYQFVVDTEPPVASHDDQVQESGTAYFGPFKIFAPSGAHIGSRQHAGYKKGKVNLNLDLTILMPCDVISVDIKDNAGNSLHLSEDFTMMADSVDLNEFHVYSQSNDGQSQNESNGQSSTRKFPPKHDSKDIVNIRQLISGAARRDRARDDAKSNWNVAGWLGSSPSSGQNNVNGCRISGQINLNKVAGNLHITSLGHGYFGVHTPHEIMNYTHVIRRLQFGLDYPGIVNPLEGTGQLGTLHFAAMSYFINVIPTTYQDQSGNVLITNQYAYTHHKREWVDESAAQTTPGLFFRYDFEPIAVQVSEQSTSITRFLLRVASVCGGIWYLSSAFTSVLVYLNSVQDKTFRSVKPNFPFMQASAKRDQLKQYIAVTMGGGSMKAAVQLPPGQDRSEWLAINAVDFFNEVNMIYGCVAEFCTDQSCPVMSAGKKYEYLLWPDAKNPKPQNASAPQYVSKLMEWIEQQLDNEKVFVSDGPFPADFETNHVRTIFKRLFRVYAHIYHNHTAKIEEIGETAHLNTCFKHFLMFCQEFNLVDDQEQKPLVHIIEQLSKKN